MFWSLVHVDFSVIISNNGFKGRRNFARFGMNLMKWCTNLRNDLPFFSVFGGFNLLKTLIFVSSGFKPRFIKF